MQKLLIGIIACNHKTKTLACLESLASNEFRDFKVFLVDNGSGENLAQAAAGFDFVTVHTETVNLGASGGRNIIIRYFLNEGNWPYLLFLDNDMVVFPKTLTQAMEAAEALQNKGIRLGALGVDIVYRNQPERIWSAGGGTINWQTGWFENSGQGTLLSMQANKKPRKLDTIPSAFLFAVREAVQAAGFFIEDYFIYLEDTDWCWQIVKAGYELWHIPGILAMHDVSSSMGKCTPRFYYLRTRNRLWFFQAFTSYSRLSLCWAILRHVFSSSLYPELRAGQWDAAGAILKGFWDGLRIPDSIKNRTNKEFREAVKKS